MNYPSTAIRPLFPVATGLAEDAVKLLEACEKPGALCTVAYVGKVRLLANAVEALAEKAEAQLTPSLCGSKAEADEAYLDCHTARICARYALRHLEAYRRESADRGVTNPTLCPRPGRGDHPQIIRAFRAELKDITTHLLRFALSCDVHGLCAD